MGLAAMRGSGGSTRTTRRIDRFNLSDRPAVGGARDEEPDSSASHRHRQYLATTATPGGAEPHDGDDDGDAPVAKISRVERFQDVVATSKERRAQQQRERADREKEVTHLDAAIADLMHLLPRRNKDEEAMALFRQGGTPEVRALLSAYRKGHVAKQLSLKSSGAFDVQPLADLRQPTSLPKQKATARGSRTDEVPAPPSLSFLDDDDRRLLRRLCGDGGAAVEERPNAVAVQEEDASTAVGRPTDDFDQLMSTFRLDTRRAHAVPRTLTEEEQAAWESQQALLKADRQAMPQLAAMQEREQTQLTRGEWLQQGGDRAFRMDDDDDAASHDDNVDLPSSYDGESDGGDADDGSEEALAGSGGEGPGRATAAAGAPAETTGHVGSSTLDAMLRRIEAIAESGDAAEDREGRAATFHGVLQELYRYATTHAVEVSQAFRLVLIEAERRFLCGSRGALPSSVLLFLVAISKLFPLSDYRHEVTTPFLLFLCSSLLQMKLTTTRNISCYLVLTTLLLHSMKAGYGKYAAEVIIAPLNVIALQLPRAVLEPARYQGTALAIPLVERREEALLSQTDQSSHSHSSTTPTASGASRGADSRPVYQIGVLDADTDAERLLLCAYQLFREGVALYRHLPAFPVICGQPFLALDALLQRHAATTPTAEAGALWRPSTAVRVAHEDLVVAVRGAMAAVAAHRTPLAMRSFRPRPLRLFDPLLAEREENAAKTEVRLMKREMREDKKRLMRHLTAEATVQRRTQERRDSVDAEQREKAYHRLIGDLQQQQHTMNAVESMKKRAKAKPQRGLSGAPSTTPAADDGAGE